MTTTFELSADPDPHDLAFLSDRLSAFNDKDVGGSGKTALAIFSRDADAVVVGGLSGYTAWGWLYVQWLWIAENQRGQGLAGKMLVAAEAEARLRGCHGAYIDTFSPAALKAYQRAGYAPFGELKDFPKGRTRTFLQKSL